MNAVTSRRSRDTLISPSRMGWGSKDNDNDYEESIGGDNDVDFYDEVPNFELTLDEFEEYALARLKVLRKIEELKARPNIPYDAYKEALKATIKSNLECWQNNGRQDLKQSKKIDVASHYILRSAYCSKEDLRQWFLTHECHLFRYRLEKLINNSLTTDASLRAFLKQSNIYLQPVSESEKARLRESLLSLPGVTPGTLAATTYYAIPFTEALELIASRRCYVERGVAYVPREKTISIIIGKFRMRLSKSLVLASAAFGHVANESARITPLLMSMHYQYTGENRFTENNTLPGDQKITSNNVDLYAAQSMPLCMSRLHAGLKQDHKLKHWGRLQYGLFLKGAGMSMEESLLFFQREFSKIMTGEEFQKKYSYNIRHMYGKEGKRASYTPYRCQKIIMGQPPQSGDHHGCPYKHYDDQHLLALLNKLNIGTKSDRDAIMSDKRAGHFQLACVKHFEAVHPQAASVKDIDLDQVGSHPNAWFAASVAYNAAKSGNATSDGGGTVGGRLSPSEVDTSGEVKAKAATSNSTIPPVKNENEEI